MFPLERIKFQSNLQFLEGREDLDIDGSTHVMTEDKLSEKVEAISYEKIKDAIKTSCSSDPIISFSWIALLALEFGLEFSLPVQEPE